MDVNSDVLERFVHVAVDDLGHHLGLAHRQLEALPPHRLDQDGQLQLAAAENAEGLGGFGILDANRDVGEQLPLQPGAQLS